MAEKEKKEHAFNIRDVSRILLSFGTKKVAIRKLLNINPRKNLKIMHLGHIQPLKKKDL